MQTRGRLSARRRYGGGKPRGVAAVAAHGEMWASAMLPVSAEGPERASVGQRMPSACMATRQHTGRRGRRGVLPVLSPV